MSIQCFQICTQALLLEQHFTQSVSRRHYNWLWWYGYASGRVEVGKILEKCKLQPDRICHEAEWQISCQKQPWAGAPGSLHLAEPPAPVSPRESLAVRKFIHPPLHLLSLPPGADSVMRLQDSLLMPWAHTCHRAYSTVQSSEISRSLRNVRVHTRQDVSHKRTAKCQRTRGKRKE